MNHGGGHDGLHRRRRRHRPQPPPPPLPALFHFLEVTMISAQDLNPTCGRTRAYAEAWVDPNYRLQTRIDPSGGTNPNWSDKFVFCVDDDYLHSDTAAVTVAIKRASRVGVWHDPVIGLSRLLLSTVNPSPEVKFVALQVRRPKSLRPQGILNLGVAVQSDGRAARETVIGRTTSSRRGGEARGYSVEMEKSGEVGRWVVEKEREALQLKLEKWRTEISPAVVDLHQKAAVPEKKRLRKQADGRLFGCFSGRSDRWD